MDAVNLKGALRLSVSLKRNIIVTMYLSKEGAIKILELLSGAIESLTIYDLSSNPYSFVNLVKNIQVDEENKEAILIISAVVSSPNIEFNKLTLDATTTDGNSFAIFYDEFDPPRVLSAGDSQIDVILRLGYSDAQAP